MFFLDENLTQTLFFGPQPGKHERQHNEHVKAVKLEHHMQRT